MTYIKKCDTSLFSGLCGRCSLCISKAKGIVMTYERIPLGAIEGFELVVLNEAISVLVKHYGPKGFMIEFNQWRLENV